MKKITAMLLVLVMALSLAACNGTANTPETTTEPTVAGPASALEVLQNIWALYGENDKFFAMGGDMNHMTDNAPGVYSLTDEGLTATLLVPADQVANIDEAASLVHGMNLNNFTFGAYHVTGDVNAFVEAMHNAIANNQWMCGFPEKMIIAVVDGNYVVAGFGINDAVTPFETAFTATYPDAEMKYNEAIG